MKTISRKDLTALSAPVFTAHNVNTLFATSDGQFFIVQDRARLHARGKNLTVYEIDRSEIEAGSLKHEAENEIEAETEQAEKVTAPAKKKPATKKKK